jgi:hypothetical protein
VPYSAHCQCLKAVHGATDDPLFGWYVFARGWFAIQYSEYEKSLIVLFRFWICQVGHQADDETPWCLSNAVNETTSFANYDYTDARFERPRRARLDTNDALNDIDGPAIIDRHACTFLDVNLDGRPDIVCGVGANKGTGTGYNELYLTGANGNVTKVLDGHGLQKYTTVR